MTVEGGDDHILKWSSFILSSRDPTHLSQLQTEIPWSFNSLIQHLLGVCALRTVEAEASEAFPFTVSIPG